MNKPWIFMGIDRSHFSAKLRPAVRYKQLHCLEYPPDLPEIVRRTGLGFIPVLVTPDGEMLQDTTDIIDELERRFPDPPLVPADPLGRVLCRILELYADELFPIVSMRTRWADPENAQEARRAFAAFSGSAATGDALAGRMNSALHALGVDEHTIPAIDAHLDELLAVLQAHWAVSPFLLGDRLSLADCALLGPFYAHLYLDRTTRLRLYDEALETCMWIERCSRPVPEAMGEWFAGPLPETLRALLELIGRDAVPTLLALEDTCLERLRESAVRGEPVPRSAGRYPVVVRGRHAEGAARTYVVWKLQRVREVVEGLDAAGREAVAGALEGTGCERLLQPPAAPLRMVKQGYRLVYE
jgi:glutathione S-transferase